MNTIHPVKKGKIKKHLSTGKIDGVKVENLLEACKTIGVTPTEYNSYKAEIEQRSYKTKK